MAEEEANPNTKAQTAGQGARETRRRKILERGSDRLAFITGQTRSIPPPTETARLPSPPTPNIGSSSSSEPQRPDEFNIPTYGASCESTMSSTLDATRHELLAKHGGSRSAFSDTTQERADFIPQVTEITTDEGVDDLAHKSHQNVASPVSRRVPDDRVDDVPRHLAPACYQSFSFKQISHCISSSENIRLLCAVTIAILVVLSYHGYGLGNQFFASLVTYRPLYLVLLTNVSVVLWLLLNNQEPEKHEDVRQTGGGKFDLVKALEIGLVVQQAVRAAFVDCAICALIMIVGIPSGAKGVA